MNCCFSASAAEFLTTASSKWLEDMIKQYIILCGESPSTEQIAAWTDCRAKIEPFLTQCAGFDCELVFEYELPREGGRRPDVLLFSGDKLFVLEFKRKDKIKQSD
jgi:hypothetical protein